MARLFSWKGSLRQPCSAGRYHVVKSPIVEEGSFTAENAESAEIFGLLCVLGGLSGKYLRQLFTDNCSLIRVLTPLP